MPDDKGKQYDRAFAGSSLAARRAPPPVREHPIDEESGLDGDSYIATTQAQPWGAPPEDDEPAHDDAPRRAGLGGLISEMYDVSGKKW